MSAPARVGGLFDHGVEPRSAHELPAAPEASGGAYLGEQVSGAAARATVRSLEHMTSKLMEVILRSRDVERSRRFYELLGAPCGEILKDPEDQPHVHAVWGKWAAGSDDFLISSTATRTAVGAAFGGTSRYEMALFVRRSRGSSEVATVL